MNLHETGDVTTPVDDPCQFNPAWRSMVAGYLFSQGIRCEADFESIAKSGSVTVTFLEEVDEKDDHKEEVQEKKKKPKKGEKKDKRKKKVQTKAVRPVPPFDTNPEYRPFASDKWIRAMVYMMDARVSGNHLADEHVPLRLADMWYHEMDTEAAMKKRIEPLLLTEIGIDVIALDLTGLASVQPAIEAYERLYFNCRDENFNLSGSLQLVQRFAMPYGPLKTFLRKYEELDSDGFVIGDGRPIAKDSDVWRAIAATMGYEALMYVWKWDTRAHGMKNNSVEHMLELSWKVAASRLFQDLYNGDIKHEDAARVLAAYTAQSKKISDDKTGGGSGGVADTTKALMDLLYLAAPKMVRFDEADVAARNDEIQSRINSQLAIDKTKIQDAGKQVESEIIDAQIADAVEI